MKTKTLIKELFATEELRNSYDLVSGLFVF